MDIDDLLEELETLIEDAESLDLEDLKNFRDELQERLNRINQDIEIMSEET